MPHLQNWAPWLAAALLIVGPVPGVGKQPSADTIVAEVVQAMGGTGRLEALRTLRFEYSAHGPGNPATWEIVRPNLVRKEIAGEFILIFDGHRAGFLQKHREDGTYANPYLVPKEDWHHFEMDIALWVPAFLDYAASYAGKTDVDGHPAYLLTVSLPMGGDAAYVIDAQTFLPVRVDLPDWGLQRRQGDFREVEGFLFPHRFWDASNPANVTVLENLKVNQVLDRNQGT
jgi:hypothetical protein|tara:strand:+ start:711 stop:1397 length:687 start_codon:yes stop_codon:yes gene_type:complete